MIWTLSAESHPSFSTMADGATARAAYWAEQLAQAQDRTSASIEEHAQMALARVALAEGKASEALERLAPLLSQARTRERWGDAIEVLVLQALAYQMHHDERQALTALAEAVCRAEPEGYIRIFADEGAPSATLLAQLRDQERRRGPTPYLDTVEYRYLVPVTVSACRAGQLTFNHPLSLRRDIRKPLSS
jgi:LuxR family maltose regulon positive regulatory protein